MSADRQSQSSWRWIIAGQLAFSQRVVFTVLVFLSLGSLANATQANSADSPGAAYSVLLPFLGAWAFFTVSGLIIDRTVTQNTRSRQVLVLVVYALTDTIRTLISLLAGSQGPFTLDIEFYSRMIAAPTSGLIVFSVVSSLYNDSALYRREFDALLRARERIAGALASSQQAIETTRREIEARVNAAIENLFTQVMLEKTLESYRLVAQGLFDITTDIVRPMSRELSEQITTATRAVEDQAFRIRFRRIFALTTTVAPIRPGVNTLVVGLLMLPTLLVTGQWLTKFSALAAIGVFYLVHWVANRVFGARLGRWPGAVRTIAITFTYVVATIPVIAMFGLSEFGSQISVQTFAVYVSVFVVLLLWFMATLVGLSTARTETLHEFEQLNSNLTWALARSQSRDWVERQGLVLLLHGDVQGTFLAAGIKLQQAIDAGRDPEVVLAEVRPIVERAAAIVLKPQVRVPFAELVENLHDRWSGVSDFRCEITPEATAIFNNDYVGQRIALELLSEFVTNAVKHGHATSVTAQISVSSPRLVALHMRSAGEKNAPASVAGDEFDGLGSALFRGVTLEPILKTTQDGVVATCEIPCI